MTYAPYIHVLGECFVSLSPGLPDPGTNLPPRDRARLLLNVQPSNAMFADVAHVALMIVKRAWHSGQKKGMRNPCCAPLPSPACLSRVGKVMVLHTLDLSRLRLASAEVCLGQGTIPSAHR